MHLLLTDLLFGGGPRAMPRFRILNGDKVKALSKTKKSVKQRNNKDNETIQPRTQFRTLSSEISTSKHKRTKTEKREKHDDLERLPRAQSVVAYSADKQRSNSDGLVKKLSNLRIGGTNRISPFAQLQPITSRYLSTFTVSDLTQIADLLKTGKCKNVIVMAGAGISTGSGIPDFRTPGSGLYDNLQEYNLPHPTAVFDIYYFMHNPKPFFRLAKELYPGNFQPNYAHYFMRVLHEKGYLLRLYTQNIDALERIAGIPEDKLVEAHGSFATATCQICKAKYSEEEIKVQVMDDVIPICRKHGCQGVVKPDIVFFGEDLPARFYKYRSDFSVCDLLIVLGTSLEVEPFAGLVYEVKRSTPRLLINREVVGVFRKKLRRPNDVVAKGDITKQVQKLAGYLGWTDDVQKLLPKSKIPST